MLDFPVQLSVVFPEVESEIKLRGRRGDAHQPQSQTLDLQVLGRYVLQSQHHLEQGSVGEAPLRSPRITSVLTKNPIRPSISTRLRPATGAPTARSCCPLERARRAWNPASSTMKRVAPSRRPRASACRAISAGSRTGREAPRKLCTAGRGRSV